MTVGHSFGGTGFGYIKRKLPDFNRAAKGIPFFTLVDLVDECPVDQITNWLPDGPHRNLVFRIAIKESESWIMADTEGVSNFLRINRNQVPSNVDDLPDPKKTLLNLASKSRSSAIRRSLVPKPNTTAIVGPDYNSVISDFVLNTWNLDEASNNSPSLRRALNSIQDFDPFIEAEE